MARTAELRAAGRDIISFGAGQPDFDTPPNICAAGKAAIDEGQTRYTAVAGVVELRRAVAAEYASRGLSVDPGDVLVTAGAKYALFQALQCTVNPGDRVVIPTPYWLSYPEMVRAADGTPVFVECAEADGFKLRPENLRRAAQGARVLVLNGVSNPTGAVHTRDELAALAEVCADLDLTVISDEIYERLVYDGLESCSFAVSGSDAADRTITISGVSKTFAMTGWRIGWATGPSDIIAAMRKLQSQSTSNPSAPAQWAAVEALTGPQEPMAAMVAQFVKRRDRMLELLRDIPGVHVATPGGAFYVLPRIDAFFGRREGLSGSLALAEALLEEANVAVVPGAPFGSDAHVRLSYATSMNDIESGLARLREWLIAL